MVIRVKTEIQTKPINALKKYAKNYRDLVKEYGQDAFIQIREPALSELKFYPPKRPGQRYKRTFKLRRGWKIFLQSIGSDKFALVISNDVDYAPFVVGSLAQAVNAAAKFQAQVHKGRWPLATETAAFWREAFLEILLESQNADMQKLGTIKNKTRAFTRI